MYRAMMIVIAVLGAALLLPGGGSPAAAADLCSVSINAPAEVAPGSGFTVSVDVSEIAALDAGQFDVSFDESLLRLEDVTAGQVGTTRIPVDLWSRVGTGTYRVIVNVPGVAGVTGQGSLAVLHFQAASSAGGSLTLTPSNGFLNSNLGVEIAATWAGDSISVLDSPGAPAPSGTDGPVDTMGATASGGTPAWAWALVSMGGVIAAGGTALFIRNRRARR
jgi:hypothetical protein